MSVRSIKNCQGRAFRGRSRSKACKGFRRDDTADFDPFLMLDALTPRIEKTISNFRGIHIAVLRPSRISSKVRLYMVIASAIVESSMMVNANG